jgi:hypothetical protein
VHLSGAIVFYFDEKNVVTTKLVCFAPFPFSFIPLLDTHDCNLRHGIFD